MHTPYNQSLPLNRVYNLNITTILQRWHLIIIIRSITSRKRGKPLCCLIEGDEGEDGVAEGDEGEDGVAERDLWFFKGRGVSGLYGKGKGRLAAGL